MNKKITIGLFNDSFFPIVDGVVIVVDNYARRLSKFANVIVFVPRYINKEFDDSKLPYKVVRAKSLILPFIDYDLPIPKLDSKFKKELNSYHLDIVHIHSPFTMGKIGIKYAKENNIPVIATMHSQFKQDFQRAVKFNFLANYLTHKLIKVFNECDSCYAVNKEIARIFYEDYKYKQLPGVLPNATEMKPVKDKNELIAKKYNLKSNLKVFLFVGRLNNLKNIFFLVESLKILKEKKVLPFKMLFVGSGQDEKKLRELIKKYSLEEDIVLCGKVTNREYLAYYYKRADLFLFPSLYDASSIVQIEAASQKTPTLFLKGSATSSNITEDINGYLSLNDPSSYALKIIEIFKDKELYQKVCENAYRDLYKTWDDIVLEVYNLYLDLISKKQN